ncbi:diacylglycerol kinase [Alcaligenaceae bacterium]|nr:diacylglycerol kinase [Alcaligenaceae bacterium]
MSLTKSPYKSKGGLGRLFNALRYSQQGLWAACRHEAAFRQELVLTLFLVPVAFWLSRSLGELLLLLGSLVLLLVVELLNSALEALADAITLDHHPLIGRAKDLGSAAVMLTLLFGAVVWVSLFVIRFMPA